MIILDEPTAALGVKQSGVVLKYIVKARDAGLGVIFITHNPHHAYLVGNHFVILKLGRVVLDAHRDELTLEQLTGEMAGGQELDELSHELRGDRPRQGRRGRTPSSTAPSSTAGRSRPRRTGRSLGDRLRPARRDRRRRDDGCRPRRARRPPRLGRPARGGVRPGHRPGRGPGRPLRRRACDRRPAGPRRRRRRRRGRHRLAGVRPRGAGARLPRARQADALREAPDDGR